MDISETDRQLPRKRSNDTTNASVARYGVPRPSSRWLTLPSLGAMSSPSLRAVAGVGFYHVTPALAKAQQLFRGFFHALFHRLIQDDFGAFLSGDRERA